MQSVTELRNFKHTYTFIKITNLFAMLDGKSKVTYLVRRVTIIHQISKANTATEENNESKTSECQPHLLFSFPTTKIL